MCESVFAPLECELLDRHRFRTRSDARMAVLHFIEGFYNPSRRHSAPGCLSQIGYERKHHELTCPAQAANSPRKRVNSNSSMPSASHPGNQASQGRMWVICVTAGRRSI